MGTAAPILRIDLGSQTPAYRQIANALRALLVDGKFQPGDQLPTVRQLAMDLGVHHNTVAESYRILAEEGWLDLKRRRGVTVIPRSKRSPDSEVRTTFTRRLQELVAEARAAGIPAQEMARRLRSLAESIET